MGKIIGIASLALAVVCIVLGYNFLGTSPYSPSHAEDTVRGYYIAIGGVSLVPFGLLMLVLGGIADALERICQKD